jgi:hypothetical protein
MARISKAAAGVAASVALLGGIGGAALADSGGNRRHGVRRGRQGRGLQSDCGRVRDLGRVRDVRRDRD